MDQEKTLDSINKLLLLKGGKEEASNVLAMLGLYTIDFSGNNVRVVKDAKEIAIQAKSFSPTCTCYESGNAPKLTRIADGTMHAMRCDLTMSYKLVNHPCLIDVDGDGKDTFWTFTWPRDIEPYKNVIQSVFPELESETLWNNFKHRWEEIVSDMGPQPKSLNDRINPELNDFDGDIPFDTAMEGPMAEPETQPIPEEPAIPPKRGRGRPRLEAGPRPHSAGEARAVLVRL